MKLAVLFAKYSLAGVVNGAVSYTLIFGCMLFGVSPTTSNILGYSAGLITSYIQSRYWVFRSENQPISEGLRFLICFAAAFLVNFCVLKVLLAYAANPYLAQLLACIAYILVGFSLNSTFVFAKRKPKT